jgi:ActR/RegA family two-component response regulator
MSQKEPVIVLFIEDDQAHAEVVQRAFLNYGLKTEVRVAGIPQEA